MYYAHEVIKIRKAAALVLCSAMAGVGTMAFTGAGPFAQELKVTTGEKTVEYGTQLRKSMFDTSVTGSARNFVNMTLLKKNFQSDKVGEYAVKVKATDINGQQTSKNVSVKVIDTTAPVISQKKKAVVEAGSSFDVHDYLSATDNADGDISYKLLVNGTLDTKDLGKHIITVQASDSSGNTSAYNLEVTVTDTTPPKITTKGEMYAERSSKWNVKDSFEAKDIEDGDITPELTSQTLDTSKSGKQDITVRAVDKSGNVSYLTKTFKVGDKTAPVLSLTKDKASVNVGDDFDAKSYIGKATDNADGDVTKKVKISDFSTDEAGTFDIAYDVSDKAGNKAQTQHLTLKVKDPVKSFSDAVLARAATKLGLPYVFGATGPNSYDCSGFTQWVYGQFGISLPRTAAEQANALQKVDEKDARPGDLVFFQGTYKPGVSHVGIYMGDGEFINAGGDHVQYARLEGYYRAHFYGFGRVYDAKTATEKLKEYKDRTKDDKKAMKTNPYNIKRESPLVMG